MKDYSPPKVRLREPLKRNHTPVRGRRLRHVPSLSRTNWDVRENRPCSRLPQSGHKLPQLPRQYLLGFVHLPGLGVLDTGSQRYAFEIHCRFPATLAKTSPEQATNASNALAPALPFCHGNLLCALEDDLGSKPSNARFSERPIPAMETAASFQSPARCHLAWTWRAGTFRYAPRGRRPKIV